MKYFVRVTRPQHVVFEDIVIPVAPVTSVEAINLDLDEADDLLQSLQFDPTVIHAVARPHRREVNS